MTSEKPTNTPIAVVGIGARFPQAPDADQFWQGIAAGYTAFSDVPRDRWNHDIFFSDNQRDIDKAWTKKGSFLESYREFAPMHYGIAPRRLEVMDPQQRLLIEATRVAIQDAGYETAAFERSRTGVYVGVSIAEFQQITNARIFAMRLAGGDFGAIPADPALRQALIDLTANVVPMRAFTLSGSLTALASAAIAQTFDLGGPAYTMDSACASASIAVHDAVNQLRTGAIDGALAGGAYLNLAPDNLVAFTKIGAISPSGVCRPFDARADGFVQSDGVAMLFLKRLDDAMEAGDRVYAVIRGSGCNNDGRGEGPMTPRKDGQKAVLRTAYADAGVTPDSVAYFEAHGTATSIGDPVEVSALGETLLEAGVPLDRPAPIGSVKGNIGHAMSAAGIAGLVKAIKVLQNRTVPPQPGFETANPKLGLDRYPLRVPTEASDLMPRGGHPLRVAVSSFGFGGTNSHIVLEEAPTVVRAQGVSRPLSVDLDHPEEPASEAVRPEAVLVTAPTPALLAGHLGELADAVQTGSAKDASLADLAYTLNARRRHERFRAVVGARTPLDLLTNLRAAAEVLAGDGVAFPQVVNRDVTVHDAGEPDAEPPKVAFLFPGQGAQRVGLLADVKARFPRFAEAFSSYAQAADRSLPRPLSGYLYPDPPADDAARAEADAALRATEVCQPAMAALGLATATLLRELGVEPTASLGHSLGEFATLASAGVLTPEEAVRLVTVRGAAMRALPHADPGTMAAVMADEHTVREALGDLEGVWIANVNHPRQVSISGTTPGVARAAEVLAARELDVRPLDVSHAFHTPLVDGVSDAVGKLLGTFSLSAPQHVAASCIEGAPHDDDADRTRRILMQHATSTVRFTRGLEQVEEAGATVFVQAGAGNLLTNLAKATLGREGRTFVELADVAPDGGYPFVRGLCTLAAVGLPVALERAYADEDRRVVTLPETPLERQAYWPVKDREHPKAEITAPISDAQVGLRTVSIEGAAASESPAAPAGDAGLVELFARQNQILAQTAEIIATQNRLLLGEGAVAAGGTEALEALEGKISALMQEPSAAPAPEAPPTTPAAEAAPTPDATPKAPVVADDAATIEARVLEVVAKVSAFPQANLRKEQRLVDELGFDSLMVADLSAALQGAYPNLGQLPPTLFDLKTTLGDLSRHVTETLASGGAPEEEPEAPLGPVSRYRVVPVERSRVHLPRLDITGKTWLVTEDSTGLASEISAGLAARGAELIRVRFTTDGVAAPARLARGTLNLWPEAFVEGLADAVAEAGGDLQGVVHAASLNLSDAKDFVNPVDLLHPIAAGLDPEIFVTITGMGGRMGLEKGGALSRNVLQAALSGYTKSLARERPRARIRCLDVDSELAVSETAPWVVDEILGGDQSPEAGYDGRRWVAELAAVGSGPGEVRRIGGEDVVLITGGTGEIGARAARWVAEQGPKAIVLLGRRPEDDAIRAQLTELAFNGAKTRYLAVDLSDKEAFRAALKPAVAELGPVTVALHAAGIIEDARADKKSLQSVHRVMDVKVRGLQTILRSCPELQDVVLFSSWAGRFGNAGQTDYSAANELLDRISVVGVGSARIVSIVWPPWSSTKMVRTIPEPIQAAMRKEGVTFLDDDEGIAVLDAIFREGIRGIEIVGRDLPARAISVEHTEHFSLGRHPYLDDHRLEGRAVVPLASATDLLGWAFRETTGRVGPLVVEDLELARGLAADDTARVIVQGRRGIDGVTEAKFELRTVEDDGGQGLLAYRGRASNRPVDLSGAPALGGESVPQRTDLETFYAKQTFHGPRFEGIEAIERITSEGIEGKVHGAPVAAWLPHAGRRQWTVDPLVLDASFQLAGYWLFDRHGKAGFPVGFERLELSRPFGPEAVGVRIHLSNTDEAGFSGDIYYFDTEGVQVGRLVGIRGRFAELSASGDADEAPASEAEASSAEVPDASWQIGKFPEIEELDQRFQMAELMGLRNPYFNLHNGTARDTSEVDGVEMINFSSYNYLGFSGHPQVVDAAQQAIARYGTSVSASRVASGERPVHRELEAGIAKHVGVEAALVFVSGHATNVTTVGHMLGREDLVLHDSLIHDSILQGIYLSGATRRPFPHNDLDALERALVQVRGGYRRVLIVAEGIYSMDGDICDLPRLIELKKRFKTLLMIDEAHSAGVLGHAGRGIADFEGVDANDVDIWMGTLSKSFASCGGYIAGSEDLIRYLKYTAPGFVYSAGIPPPNAAAALKSLELMHAQPDIVEQCRARSRFFLERARAKGIDTGDAIGAAVVPAIIGNSLVCMRLSENLAKRSINVQPIVYPAVEDEKARLRFFISALHTEEQLSHTVDVMVEELAKVRAELEGGGASASL